MELKLVMILAVLSWIPLNSAGDQYDICETSNLRISSYGKEGTIVLDSKSMSSSIYNPCVLKVESCSNCQIGLQPFVSPTGTEPKNFSCHTDKLSSHNCVPGCDYMYIFDMYFMNETLRYYQKWSDFKDGFKSESSNVFIVFCHGSYYPRNFTLRMKYNTTEKIQQIQGSGQKGYTGNINSPYFGIGGYAMNHEFYKFNFSSPNVNDRVLLTFDDWHLADTSALYFGDSNIQRQWTGQLARPVVLSKSNKMEVVFQTGQSLDPGNPRVHLGFKATYLFTQDIPVFPITDCKDAGYIMNSNGGKIELKSTSPEDHYYDCLWVVAKQNNYDEIYARVIKFKTRYNSGGLIQVLGGLTSDGRSLFSVETPEKLEKGLPINYSGDGLYIRFTGHFTSSDSLIIVFASYTKHTNVCGLGMFRCLRGTCIDNKLQCDGYDHCGDNSDETTCGDYTNHWDKSYQYTITIGVIVPMVISVFLIMVLCLLFVMIRRCRRARLLQSTGSAERLGSGGEEGSNRRGRRRRRHRRNLFRHIERDLPPTYDEAIQSPPAWYTNVAFRHPVDPTLPQPPSYHDAISQDQALAPPTVQHHPGSPISSDSSQSELTIGSQQPSDSSSSSDEECSWGTTPDLLSDGRRGRRSRHSSSSNSDREWSPAQNSSSVTESTSVTQSSSVMDLVSSRSNLESLNNRNDSKVQQPLLENVENKNTNKVLKKQTGSYDCVIPTHDKPDGGNTGSTRELGQIVIVPRTSEIARENLPPQSQCEAGVHTTEESEIAAGGHQKGKKKNKKVKGRKQKKVKHASRESNDVASSGATNFDDNSDDDDGGFGSREPQIRNLGQSVARETVGSNPAISSGPLDSNYNVIVNVDNDDILVLYDSPRDRDGVPSTLNNLHSQPDPNVTRSPADEGNVMTAVARCRNSNSSVDILDGSSARRTVGPGAYMRDPVNERSNSRNSTSSGGREQESVGMHYYGSRSSLQGQHDPDSGYLNLQGQDGGDVYV